MNKCIRMGITAFKFVIWGGKSAVLRSEISFYGDASTWIPVPNENRQLEQEQRITFESVLHGHQMCILDHCAYT